MTERKFVAGTFLENGYTNAILRTFHVCEKRFSATSAMCDRGVQETFLGD